MWVITRGVIKVSINAARNNAGNINIRKNLQPR